MASTVGEIERDEPEVERREVGSGGLWSLAKASLSLKKQEVQFLVSFGGNLGLRHGTEGPLRYLGGQTHLVSLPVSAKLGFFIEKLKSVAAADEVIIKYQLPGEDLDTLVSIVSNEDFDTFLQENKRTSTVPGGGPRIHVYIFPKEEEETLKKLSHSSTRSFVPIWKKSLTIRSLSSAFSTRTRIEEQLDSPALPQLKVLLSNHTSRIHFYGIDLNSNTGCMDPRADVVLQKFLVACDFKVEKTFKMLLKSAAWRAEFGVDSLIEQQEDDFGFKDLNGVVAFMHGQDRDGYPVCYNTYSVFQDPKIHDSAFGTPDRLRKFLKWRVRLMELGVRALSLLPGGKNSITQVVDLKFVPSLPTSVTNQLLEMFQNNYPEMVYRKIFINVPLWFSLTSPFLSSRSRSKFIIARDQKASDVLYKYINPEQFPTEYGGLSRIGDLLNAGLRKFVHE